VLTISRAGICAGTTTNFDNGSRPDGWQTGKSNSSGCILKIIAGICRATSPNEYVPACNGKTAGKRYRAG